MIIDSQSKLIMFRIWKEHKCSVKKEAFFEFSTVIFHANSKARRSRLSRISEKWLNAKE